MTNLDSVLESKDINFADKILDSQTYGFFSSHVQKSELDHKEGRGAEELMPLNCVAGEDP